MSIAFLEGAEYEAATRHGEPEETAMTIDYAERYDDKQIHRMLTALYGNGGIRLQTVAPVMTAMRDELIAAIDELRSTITAQHDTLEEQAALIAQQIELLDEKNKRITELEAALERTQQSREYRTNLLLTSMDKSSARIAELEAQLAAALATIERAL
jgi:restriction endonuclease